MINQISRSYSDHLAEGDQTRDPLRPFPFIHSPVPGVLRTQHHADQHVICGVAAHGDTEAPDHE